MGNYADSLAKIERKYKLGTMTRSEYVMAIEDWSASMLEDLRESYTMIIMCGITKIGHSEDATLEEVQSHFDMDSLEHEEFIYSLKSEGRATHFDRHTADNKVDVIIAYKN